MAAASKRRALPALDPSSRPPQLKTGAARRLTVGSWSSGNRQRYLRYFVGGGSGPAAGPTRTALRPGLFAPRAGRCPAKVLSGSRWSCVRGGWPPCGFTVPARLADELAWQVLDPRRFVPHVPFQVASPLGLADACQRADSGLSSVRRAAAAALGGTGLGWAGLPGAPKSKPALRQPDLSQPLARLFCFRGKPRASL